MNKFEVALEWVAARFEEPSTWGGAGVVAVLLHSIVKNQALVDSILATCAAIGGLLAIVVPQPNRTTVNNNVTVSNTASITLPKNSTTTISSNTTNKDVK